MPNPWNIIANFFGITPEEAEGLPNQGKRTRRGKNKPSPIGPRSQRKSRSDKGKPRSPAKQREAIQSALPYVLENSGLGNARDLSAALSGTSELSGGGGAIIPPKPPAAPPGGIPGGMPGGSGGRGPHRGPPIIPGKRIPGAGWQNILNGRPAATPTPTGPGIPNTGLGGVGYDAAGAMLPPSSGTASSGGQQQAEQQEEVIRQRRQRKQKQQETWIDRLTAAFKKLTGSVTKASGQSPVGKFLQWAMGGGQGGWGGGGIGGRGGLGQGGAGIVQGNTRGIGGMAMRGATKLGGMIGGKAGMALMGGALMAGSALAVIGAFAKLRSAALDYAQAQADSLRPLAQFNASIAGAFLRSDYKEKVRMFQQGAANSESSSKFVNAYSDLQDELAPMKMLMTEIYNSIGITLVGYLHGFQQQLNNLPFLKGMLDELKKKGQAEGQSQRQAMTKFFNAASGTVNRKPGERQ